MQLNLAALKNAENKKLVSVYKRKNKMVIVPAPILNIKNRAAFTMVRLIVEDEKYLQFSFTGDILGTDAENSGFLLDLKDQLDILYYLVDD